MLPILILFAYWLIFWKKFLRNPYLLCTSEIASTYFPFWLSMGRKWKPVDNIYYKYPACIPFLSMFYLPSVLISKLSKFLSLNISFKIYAYFILLHYFLASVIAYKVFGLFGAITLTYAGYCIKPQTPSFVYTMCWIPGIFLGGPFGALSAFMAITGGYWPILVYVLPVVAVMSFNALFVGFILAFPQLVAFAWYWGKSVRCGEKVDRNFGKLPWWKLKDIFWPSKSVGLINGVHYPEAQLYCGIAIFLIWQVSFWWIPLVFALFVSIGFLFPIQRIPSRSIYLLTLSIAFLSSHKAIDLQWAWLVQSFLLLRNASIYPSFPFSQWWRKPSELYQKFAYNGTWPNVTGYLKNIPISTYQGAFRLK